MPRAKVFRIDDNNTSFVNMSAYNSSKGKTNINDINRRKDFLGEAISRELTPRQRELVIGYYIEGKKIPQLAQEHKINRSTVSRHLSAAKRKLSRFAHYIQ